MAFSDFFTRLFGKAKQVEQDFVAKGSAFARHAVHEAEVLEAKGKILALDAVNALAHAALDELTKEAARVHAAQDAIAAKRAELLKLL